VFRLSEEIVYWTRRRDEPNGGKSLVTKVEKGRQKEDNREGFGKGQSRAGTDGHVTVNQGAHGKIASERKRFALIQRQTAPRRTGIEIGGGRKVGTLT